MQILKKITHKRFLIIALVWNFVVYYGGKLVAKNFLHTDITLSIDAAIPFLPWTVSIYILSFLFWAINYTLAAMRDERAACRLFLADFLGKAVAFAFFVFLPTTCIRPEIVGDGVWEALVRFIYLSDEPTNLLPSLHCYSSIISALAVCGYQKIPQWYKAFSWVFAAAVCVSTVTTKQHVFVDIPAGVFLAVASYLVAKNLKLQEYYKKVSSFSIFS